MSQGYYWIAVKKRCVLTIKNIKDVTDEIAIVSNFGRMISQFFFYTFSGYYVLYEMKSISISLMYCVDRVKYLFCRILRKNSGNFGR